MKNEKYSFVPGCLYGWVCASLENIESNESRPLTVREHTVRGHTPLVFFITRGKLSFTTARECSTGWVKKRKRKSLNIFGGFIHLHRCVIAVDRFLLRYFINGKVWLIYLNKLKSLVFFFGSFRVLLLNSFPVQLMVDLHLFLFVSIFLFFCRCCLSKLNMSRICKTFPEALSAINPCEKCRKFNFFFLKLCFFMEMFVCINV